MKQIKYYGVSGKTVSLDPLYGSKWNGGQYFNDFFYMDKEYSNLLKLKAKPIDELSNNAWVRVI